ncbi:hypothetical protein ON010_g15608 [Phytophthora cinnamomi]|nr:hypothetical protein ON010_g15608 [Phytophthora cinnamomi]
MILKASPVPGLNYHRKTSKIRTSTVAFHFVSMLCEFEAITYPLKCGSLASPKLTQFQIRTQGKYAVAVLLGSHSPCTPGKAPSSAAATTANDDSSWHVMYASRAEGSFVTTVSLPP